MGVTGTCHWGVYPARHLHCPPHADTHTRLQKKSKLPKINRLGREVEKLMRLAAGLVSKVETGSDSLRGLPACAVSLGSGRSGRLGPPPSALCSQRALVWAPICRSHCPLVPPAGECPAGKGSDQLRGHRGPHRPTAPRAQEKNCTAEVERCPEREAGLGGGGGGLAAAPAWGGTILAPVAPPPPPLFWCWPGGLGMQSSPLSPRWSRPLKIYLLTSLPGGINGSAEMGGSSVFVGCPRVGSSPVLITGAHGVALSHEGSGQFHSLRLLLAPETWSEYLQLCTGRASEPLAAYPLWCPVLGSLIRGQPGAGAGPGGARNGHLLQCGRGPLADVWGMGGKPMLRGQLCPDGVLDQGSHVCRVRGQLCRNQFPFLGLLSSGRGNRRTRCTQGPSPL